MSWFLYVVRCDDDTLYAGITTDIDRRIAEHNGSPKGARYTRARRPVQLAGAWRFDDRSSASKAEYGFKRVGRDDKLRLIAGEALELAASLDLVRPA